MPLLKFTSSIVLAPSKSGTYETSRLVVRPRSSRDKNPQLTKKQKLPTEGPIGDVCYDNIAHWPKFRPTKSKCHHCKIETGRVSCKKCNMFFRLLSEVTLCSFLKFLDVKNIRYCMFFD